MTTLFITYATNNGIHGLDYASTYEHFRKDLVQQFNNYGCEHYEFDKDWLHGTSYYEKFKSILDEKRGAGYWAWKPYIMYYAMENLAQGDSVMYLDSTTKLLDNPLTFANELAGADVQTFAMRSAFEQKQYCKRDCFVLMNCDTEQYWGMNQLWAGMVYMHKSKDNMNLLLEWMQCCGDRRIVTDDENVMGLPNFEGFIEHRHDQAILTLLFEQHNIHPKQYTTLFQDI